MSSKISMARSTKPLIASTLIELIVDFFNL